MNRLAIGAMAAMGCIAAALFPVAAGGDVIDSAGIDILYASTTFAGRSPTLTLNGNVTTNVSRYNMYVGTTNAAVIEYFLNGSYAVTNLSIWNYNGTEVLSPLAGMKDIEILISDDYGESFSKATNPATGTSIFTLPKAPGDATILPTEIPLQATATHVRIDAVNNYGYPGYSGLSEVRFYGAPVDDIAMITNVSIESVSSESGSRPASNTLDGTPYVVDPNVMYQAQIETPVVVYDLGGARTLHHLLIWNWAMTGYTSRGMREITLAVSLDNVSFTELTDPSDGDQVFELPQAPGTADGDNLPEFIYTPATPAAYLRLSCLSNHGATGTTGLSEIAFYEQFTTSTAGTILVIR